MDANGVKSQKLMDLLKRLPEELILEIFVKLPLRSLFIFRCVSKSWCNQLDNNPEFVRIIEDNFSLVLINDDKRVGSLDNNTLSSSLSDGIQGHFKKIHCPLVPFGWNLERINFVGSSNGLLCMYHVAYSSYDVDEERVCLWNLCTNEIRFVPRSGFQSLLDRRICIWDRGHGFGYDSENDDYKYVHIFLEPYSRERGSEVQIYSFRTNTWKQIYVPYSLANLEGSHDQRAPNGALCNGALHWFGAEILKCHPMVLLALDMTEEGVREIPQPESQDDKMTKYVDVLDECLCILYSSCATGYEVWVMKDYGKRESWTIMYNISDLTLLGVKSFLYLRGIECLKTGEILLEVHYDSFHTAALVSYDPKNGKTTVLKLHKRYYYESLFCRYVKSSVKLDSESYTEENEQEQNDQLWD